MPSHRYPTLVSDLAQRPLGESSQNWIFLFFAAAFLAASVPFDCMPLESTRHFPSGSITIRRLRAGLPVQSLAAGFWKNMSEKYSFPFSQGALEGIDRERKEALIGADSGVPIVMGTDAGNIGPVIDALATRKAARMETLA